MSNKAKAPTTAPNTTDPSPTARKVVEPSYIRHWRAWVFQGYVVAAAVAFVALFLTAATFNYLPVDLSVTRSLQTIQNPWFAHLMWLVSWYGFAPQAAWVTAAIAAALFIFGLRWEGLMAIWAGAGASALGALVKLAAHRPRPTADLVLIAQELNGYSFPSGHVLQYTAFFGFLLFLSYTLLKPSFWRGLLLVFFGLLIVLVGPSRIYLGGHWVSDVMGAYLLGSLWLALSIWLYRWGKPRFFVRQPAAAEKPEQPGSHSMGAAGD